MQLNERPDGKKHKYNQKPMAVIPTWKPKK